MIKLLNCPQIDEKSVLKFLQLSKKEKQFSNFGICETLLCTSIAESLSVPVKQVCTGSNATALLFLACRMLADANGAKMGTGYFPAFSFFSTFSIASSLDHKKSWYDLDVNWNPCLQFDVSPRDFVFYSVPFGSPNIDRILKFSESMDCPVIIDAAACLPGLLFHKIKLNSLPKNVIIVFSLHATKMLSAGEGALCVFGSAVPQHLKKLTNFGIAGGRQQSWTGSFNAKLSEFNAAAALSSLESFDARANEIMLAKRKAKKIGTPFGLQFFDDVDVPTLTLNIFHKKADDCLKTLESLGLEGRKWWSLQENATKVLYPNSFKFHSELLGLPFDWENIDEYFLDMCKTLALKS